ncbi:Putative membrane protein (fragment) [Xenorhabdus poinarii G6]|uniref:Putative membrane protein n=1 Tax=Xenorhabdus poinarii G6 TaxID=1354304 RepID=A0A068R7Q6_9GAMM
MIGFTVSWYADFKLKENGYIACHQKSLNAPRKYIKNEKLYN